MSELQCERIEFPSADGEHTVVGRIYTMPEVPVRAVIQLSHGMCEYIERYAPMAAWFAAQGIALAGNDHLGHGDTAADGVYGYFGARGHDCIAEDLHTMNGLLREKFSGTPIVLYGHSMGSFYARWYAERWPETITALILEGTAGPRAINTVGYWLARVVSALRGPMYISNRMTQAMFGSYNKRVVSPSTSYDWITRDEAVVRAYAADPRCTFQFTVAGLADMLWTLCHVSTRKWACSLPKNLPILLIAGDADPVGNYGAGVRDVWAMLGDAGIEDLYCQIYEGSRHELHNETNRVEVFEDVLTWLNDRLPGEQKA